MTHHPVVSVPVEQLVWLLAGMGAAGVIVGLFIGWWARGNENQR
ncbi:hypothetical protein [Nonomuraea maritima]